MIKIALSILASSALITIPTAALAAPAPVMAMMEDDHPAPPFETTPECEAAARAYALRMEPNGATDPWNPFYHYYYDSYIFENCPYV